jgi:hypothetical protein
MQFGITAKAAAGIISTWTTTWSRTRYDPAQINGILTAWLEAINLKKNRRSLRRSRFFKIAAADLWATG